MRRIYEKKQVFRCAWKKLQTIRQNREQSILVLPGRLEKSNCGFNVEMKQINLTRTCPEYL